MNRIIIFIGLVVGFQGVVLGQDAAMVERVNRLSVYVEELQADKVRYQKQITDMQRELDSLRDEIQALKGGANQRDVANVAEAVKQLDRKHRSDMELVANKIDELGKKASAPPRSQGPSVPKQEQGWYYTIEPGNTLSAIAKAYRDNYKIKTTPDDILKANPGLKADRLQVGQEIFIPEK